LAYNEGTTPDFLLLELVDGRLQMGVDDGSGNTTWTDGGRLDDAEWHLVELRQKGQKRFVVSIDDRAPAMLDVPNYVDRRNVFDMFGPLFVGGLPSHLLRSHRPRGLRDDVSHFVGCLATLTVNSVLYDPTDSLPTAADPGCRS